MGKASKVHASLSLATLERQKQKVHFDTRYCRSGAQTPSQNSWQNLLAAFSFGIYFAVLACSWSVGSPAEQSHQTGMIISCVHNQRPLCNNSVPRRTSADGYNTLFHCFAVQLPSSFVVHISQFSGAYFMEAIRVFLQEVMHSNCPPSCKASLFTKVSQLLWLRGKYTSLQSTNTLLMSEDFRTKSLRQCLGH